MFFSRGEILTATALGVAAIVVGVLVLGGVGFLAGYTTATLSSPTATPLVLSPSPSPASDSNACQGITFNVNQGHSCPAGAQLCNIASPHQFTLPQPAEVFFNYDVAQPIPNVTAHCSSLRLHVRVDGNLVYTTPFMGWPAYIFNNITYPGDPQGRPLSTGFVNIGTFGAGTHIVTSQQEGTVGGCNVGYLLGGSGPVTVKADCIASKPQCSDGINNDNDDMIDPADPGCHADGNPNNNGTYDPNDNDERDNSAASSSPSPGSSPTPTFDPGGVREID